MGEISSIILELQMDLRKENIAVDENGNGERGTGNGERERPTR